MPLLTAPTGTVPVLLAAEAGGEQALGFSVTNVLFVLLAAWTAGKLAERVGYPAILGELLAGIVLGPPLLGLLDAGEGVDVLGNFGVILMMLYVGTEIDPRDLRRASVPGLLAAVGGFIVPFGLGYWVTILFGGSAIAALFVAISVGVTSLATKSRILTDLKLLDTRIAYVLMAGALLSDTATLVIFAAIIGFVEVGGFDLAGTSQVAVEAIGFFAVTGVIGIFVLPWAGRWLRQRVTVDRSLGFIVVVGVGLLFAALAEFAGLHAILGAFIAGLFLRDSVLGRRTAHRTNRLLREVSIGLLAPVFFVGAGFQIDPGVFRTDLAFLVAVVAVATFGKIFGTALFYLPTGHGLREGLTVGAAMNGRGAVEIIVAGIGVELGLISTEIFTILVFMAIFTTATVPVLLKLGVEWLRRHGELAKSQQERRGVLIVGAGPLARMLAQHLAPSRPVWLVDDNETVVAIARREGLNAVRGDALDEETLERANAERTGIFVALTKNSEVNVLAAQIAREGFFVPEVLVALRTSPSDSLENLIDRVGARPLFEGRVDIDLWDHWVALEQASPTSVAVDEGVDIEALDSRLRTGRSGFPLVVVRDGEHMPFWVVDHLEDGDEVVVLTRMTADETAAVV